MTVHECWQSTPWRDWYSCRACMFFGTLREAIAHVVEHQFRVGGVSA